MNRVHLLDDPQKPKPIDGQFLHHLEVDVAAGWLIVKQQPLDKVVCDEIKSSLPHIK